MTEYKNIYLMIRDLKSCDEVSLYIKKILPTSGTMVSKKEVGYLILDYEDRNYIIDKYSKSETELLQIQLEESLKNTDQIREKLKNLEINENI